MARIRTIKPEFWTDERVVELSAFARLLFIGLWNFADDSGRMVYSPKRAKMQIFPADDVNISELFGEIRREKLIEVYAIENVEYLQISGFEKNQKIDKRSPSKLPPPPTSPDFPRTAPTEGKGRDQGKEEEKEPSVPKRKTVLPENFPDDAERSAATAYWAKNNRRDLDPDHQASLFRSHHEMNGSKFMNWPAAWRTWYVKAVDFNKKPASGGGHIATGFQT